MNLEKEALDYLVSIGLDTEKVVEINGESYTHLQLRRVTFPSVTPVELSTLASLVGFVKDYDDAYGGTCHCIVHVASPTHVLFMGPVREDMSREVFAKVNAVLPKEISYGQFYTTEDFNINLQSRFVDNTDKKLLLKFTGLIKEETIRQTGDDGISQSALIKTGIATVDNAVVPNPVRLAPYRTFNEVPQPESLFIFRMKDGPTAALYEADGGAWRLDAMNNVADYLFQKLMELENLMILA